MRQPMPKQREGSLFICKMPYHFDCDAHRCRCRCRWCTTRTACLKYPSQYTILHFPPTSLLRYLTRFPFFLSNVPLLPYTYVYTRVIRSSYARLSFSYTTHIVYYFESLNELFRSEWKRKVFHSNIFILRFQVEFELWSVGFSIFYCFP